MAQIIRQGTNSATVRVDMEAPAGTPLDAQKIAAKYAAISTMLEAGWTGRIVTVWASRDPGGKFYSVLVHRRD